MMSAKKLKKVLIAFTLTSCVAACAASFSACEIKTNHPRTAITIEFNDKEYEIEYTLYRNMYPQTVQHFIELADAGFYDNMIVHNYTSSDWFTGAYSYQGDTSEELDYASAYSSSFLEYLERNSKEQEYHDLFEKGTFTPSVYTRSIYEKGKEIVSADDAHYTLIGEFANNDHNIEKGALTAKYGALKMFYYAKGDSNKKATLVNSFNQILAHDYKYNCATSIFAMQVGDSSSFSATNYAVFGELNGDGARKSLESLQDDIHDLNSGDFTKSVSGVIVDKLDTFAEEDGRDIETSFTATRIPLIVKSVKITKY